MRSVVHHLAGRNPTQDAFVGLGNLALLRPGLKESDDPAGFGVAVQDQAAAEGESLRGQIETGLFPGFADRCRQNRLTRIDLPTNATELVRFIGSMRPALHKQHIVTTADKDGDGEEGRDGKRVCHEVRIADTNRTDAFSPTPRRSHRRNTSEEVPKVRQS